MAIKKKKSHGGLKFLGVLVAIAAMIFGFSVGRKTEVMQRVLGHREDHRIDHTALRPRFEFASAEVHLTVAHFYNYQGTPVDLTTTEQITLDRQSQMSKSDITLERTATQVEPGMAAIPYDALNANYTEILTSKYRYESTQNEPGNYGRWDNSDGRYGTPVDPHYIPMIDDVIGFALRDKKAETPPSSATSPASGLRSSFSPTARPAVGDDGAPSAVVSSFTYHFDLTEFRRDLPILAARVNLRGPDETIVSVTMGFDAAGLLRYADVSVPPTAASTLAQLLGDHSSVTYHYTLSVEQISGEPATIDEPLQYVVMDPPSS